VQGHDVEFLLDTGSAYTALSTDLVTLFSIPVDPGRTVTIAPAQGTEVFVPLITLPALRIGGVDIMNVEALVLTFSRRLKLDGILGMNVLRRFRITIENDTGTLVLRSIRRISS
jgi:predicted aspartyl protease